MADNQFFRSGTIKYLCRRGTAQTDPKFISKRALYHGPGRDTTTMQ